MALPALLGAGARAVGGSMVKAGGRAAAGKVLGRGRKKQVQPGRIVPGREGVDGGKGGAIIKPNVKMVSAKEMVTAREHATKPKVEHISSARTLAS